MTAVKQKRDFTTGPLFMNMIRFAIPIMLTNLLQLTYNIADNIIVGRYSGDLLALGAVGATSPFTNIFLSFVIGLSAGSSIVVAQLWGARKDECTVSKSVHTVMAMSAFLGFILMALGLIFAEPIMRLMGTSEAFMSRSLIYARIICLGLPASAIYNFGAAILRAVGNSRVPLYILSSTGLVNVLLNFVFVLGFGMSVDGVAIATICSQYLSAVAVVIILIRYKNMPYGFSVRKLCIEPTHFNRVMLYGLPSALQSCMFSLGNMILRSAINTLPEVVSTAHTIAFNLDGVVHAVMTSFVPAALTFVGQNYGAKKSDRVKRVIAFGTVQVVTGALMISAIMLMFAPEIAVLFVDGNDASKKLIVETAKEIMFAILPCYFLLGLSEFVAGALRGMGYSIAAMVNALIGALGTRAVWVFLLFPLESFNNVKGLYLVYPVSWALATLLQALTLLFVWRRVRERMRVEKLAD